MLKDIHAIRAKTVLIWGKWVLTLALPLLALANHHHYFIQLVIGEAIFVLSALFTTYKASRASLSDSYWLIAVIIDACTVTFIMLPPFRPTSAAWLLYLWCMLEASLLRSKIGFAMAIVINVLSFALLLMIPYGSGEILNWSFYQLLFNVLAGTIVWISYWQAYNERLVQENLIQIMHQTNRANELEQIARQMTDYTMDVQNRAVIDQLTGLYNQTYFHNRLFIEVEKARNCSDSISLVLCDIDEFKQFNDQFGHYLGDDILRAVAHVILDSLEEPYWLAGRIGGEEMVIAIPEGTLAQAKSYGESLRQRIANTVVPGPACPLRVTVSIGVASFPDTADDAIALIKLADQAMYRAKKHGRNRVLGIDDVQKSLA